MQPCQCVADKPVLRTRTLRTVGVDQTKGRFADVTVEKCLSCGRLWLRYFVQYEAFSESGRWYMGVISEEAAGTVSPATALGVLEGLEWHVFGGSYFKTAGRRGTGPLFVDL
jgi:hypothetical protein